MNEFLNLTTSEASSKTHPIQLTDNAAQKIKALSSQNLGKLLRIFVESGGCSGFSYGFKFDLKKETDLVFEKDGFQCIIDPKSFALVAGSTLDYVDALTGAGFTLKNPNAKHTCGCGSSFAT